MRKAGLASLAFFYCDFREDQKKDLRGLLSSLLVQLCHQSDSYYDVLFKFYTEHAHIGQSYCPAPSGEPEMTSNRKLQVGPSQRKSTNSRSSAWAHLYKLPHVVGGPIL